MLLKTLVDLAESPQMRSALASDPAAALAHVHADDVALLTSGQRAKLRKRLMREVDGILDALATPQDAAIHWPGPNGKTNLLEVTATYVGKKSATLTVELEWFGESDDGNRDGVQMLLDGQPAPCNGTNLHVTATKPGSITGTAKLRAKFTNLTAGVHQIGAQLALPGQVPIPAGGALVYQHNGLRKSKS